MMQTVFSNAAGILCLQELNFQAPLGTRVLCFAGTPLSLNTFIIQVPSFGTGCKIFPAKNQYAIKTVTVLWVTFPALKEPLPLGSVLPTELAAVELNFADWLTVVAADRVCFSLYRRWLRSLSWKQKFIRTGWFSTKLRLELQVTFQLTLQWRHWALQCLCSAAFPFHEGRPWRLWRWVVWAAVGCTCRKTSSFGLTSPGTAVKMMCTHPQTAVFSFSH